MWPTWGVQAYALLPSSSPPPSNLTFCEKNWKLERIYRFKTVGSPIALGVSVGRTDGMEGKGDGEGASVASFQQMNKLILHIGLKKS